MKVFTVFLQNIWCPAANQERHVKSCVIFFFYSKEIVDEVFSLKNPSEAVEEVETLPEEFYNKPLILEKGRRQQW